MTRSEFDQQYRRIETLRAHPLLNAIEFDIPRQQISLWEAWQHPIAFLLLVAGLFGFAWVCGAWP